MNTSSRVLFFAGLFAGSAVLASAAIERIVERNFTVSGAGTLRVETQGGGIRVMPSDASVVKVVATQMIRANSEAEADELLKKLELTFDQSGNDVRVVSRYEKRPSGFRSNWPPVQVDFVITVPAAFATDLRTSGGGITIGDLEGKVSARTSGGDIRLGKMGGTIDVHTSGGRITLERAEGDVSLETSGGNIEVGHVRGHADLSTSGGNIRIDSAENVLRARTSGGNIRAAIVGGLQEDCSLSTSGGNVRVTVANSAAFQLDASTSGGDVDVSGLTLASESSNRNRSRLAGAVNGGGKLLKLRTTGGGIVVRAE